MMENYKHTTVLLDEAVNGLNIRPDGIYIDGTFGRGGHSRLILSRLGAEGRLLAIDRDPQAIAVAQEVGLTVHVFEEGYLRPSWITYERGGSNGHSRLMQMTVPQMQKALEQLDMELLQPLRQHPVHRIAQQVLRDHGKDYDDATCLVLRCPE